MIFCDSVCFEISIIGEKAKVQKLINYLKSGELDAFFEIDDDFFLLDDAYDEAAPDAEVELSFSSDEFGIEVEEFDSDEFLEILCRAAKPLYLKGSFYNFDDDEVRFLSEEGDDYYSNDTNIGIFNDELDNEARKEEADEETSY